jgi:ribosomal protein S18 acetylase RimI-like enzyme
LALRLEKSYGLNSLQLAGIRQLEALCNQFEALTMKLNWSTLESRPPDQINDYLVYQNEVLIGYLALYGFKKQEVEVSAMTHPHYRRQGIFKQLLVAAGQQLSQRGVPEFLFICERVSSSGRQCLHTIGARYDFSEYKLNLKEVVETATPPAELRLRSAFPADIPRLVHLDELCFNVDPEIAKSWLHHDLTNGKRRVMVAALKRSIIGKIVVLLEETEAYISGFCVLPEYRGQGYGKAILTQTIQHLTSEYQGPITLEVSCNNETALALYRYCGFETTTAYDYYRWPVASAKLLHGHLR